MSETRPEQVQNKRHRLRSFLTEMIDYLLSEFYWSHMANDDETCPVPKDFDWQLVEGACKWLEDSHLSQENGEALDALRELLHHS